jgi:Tol biopolymer transport system component
MFGRSGGVAGASIARRAAPVAAALLVACAGGPDAEPTPGLAGAPRPPTVAAPVAAPPTPTSASVAPSSKAASIDGRVALARGDGLFVAEAGQLRVVFAPPPGGLVKDPAWSPDGRAIAFAYAPPRPTPRPGAPFAEQLPTADLMAVDADGSNVRPIVEHDGPVQILDSPAWSSDGKTVFYGFYAATYRGQELVSETVEVRRRDVGGAAATVVARGASSPSASRDGQWLAFIGDDRTRGQTLQVMPVGGGPARGLTRADQFAAMRAPRFSPDGRTIAFAAAEAPRAPGSPQPRASWPFDALRRLVSPATAHAHGLPFEIWTVPTEGGTARQLTRALLDSPSPAWSSDGQRILVYGGNGAHLVDVASGRADTLSYENVHGGMDWRSGG